MKKHLFKKISAVLFAGALCLSAAVGCTNRTPASGETTEVKTTESVSAETSAAKTTEASSEETPEPGEQTSEPASEETSESETETRCDALFYGDSITAGGNFNDFFPELLVINYGINGATIEDLTARVGEVEARHPDKIFVLAGGNNLYSGNVDECVELFRGLLGALREACPDAEIFVESMLPLDKQIALKWDCPNRIIRMYNKKLSELAEEYGLEYIEIYPVYEYQGGLNGEMTRDGIHLNDDAYGPWAEVVRPYLEDIAAPQNPDVPNCYGISACKESAVTDNYVRDHLDELVETVVADPAFFHAEDRSLNDLYILAPFSLYEEKDGAYREIDRLLINYPIASNKQIICTISFFEDNEGNLHYNVGEVYVKELNQVCSDNKNRIVVFDEQAADSGHADEAVKIMLPPGGDSEEHDPSENVFLDLSGKYKGN
ncbi:MAG: hypothetical protein IKR59_04300 [Lachnospiraceae bacterium]|nr:hypothetical protein [Lachnospiraceae bacterium]